MSYEAELDKSIYLNVVIKIGGDFYAQNRPDSGLTIDDEFLIVDDPIINGVTVDVRKANSPIGTVNFKLKEFEGNKTSSKIMLDDNQFLEKDCVVYVGHITGSFDFADYIEIARTRVISLAKIANGYSIRTREVTNYIAQPALNTSDTLAGDIIATSTTLDIFDTSDWPDSGLIKVGNEFMFYTAKNINGTTLENLNRGIEDSSAAAHEIGSDVYLVTKLEGINPLDMILQILLSANGDLTNDPTYDVLEGGLGISPDLVSIANIESLRDNEFIGEQHTLYIYNLTNMLLYLEKNLLPSTNLRFISVDGKIDLSLLDQVDFNEESAVIDESSILRTPTWGLTSDKIVNVVLAEYDFNESTQKFETVVRYTDPDSIATFGEKKAERLSMRSVVSGFNGAIIAEERANRLLGRLSTARGRVTVRCHFDRSNINVGDSVQVVHRYLPQQGGTLGFSDRLEVMSKKVDFKKAEVTYKLEFTSYTGIRIPFIAPSEKIVNVVSQSSIEVTDAACYNVGDRILMFRDGDPDGLGNPTAGDYLPDTFKTIQSITGNVITFSEPFTTTLEVDDWLKLPDYEEATEDQKAKYGFIGANTGFFNDGSKSYQIIF